MELDKNFDMHLSIFRVILFLLKNRFSSLVRLQNFQNMFGRYLINDNVLHLAVLSALLLDILMQLLINFIRTNLVQTRIRLSGTLLDECLPFLEMKNESIHQVFENNSW